MAEDQDNAGIITHPPIIYIAGALIGLLIDNFYPLSFGYENILMPASIIILVPGVLLFVMAVGVFRKNDQSPSVHASQPKVLRTGVFAYSRNPIYVAASSWMLAAALYFDKVWLLIMLIPILIFMNNHVIRREEAYLEQKFGDDYRDYKKKVRRWI